MILMILMIDDYQCHEGCRLSGLHRRLIVCISVIHVNRSSPILIHTHNLLVDGLHGV